jgi:hypothetical protein
MPLAARRRRSPRGGVARAGVAGGTRKREWRRSARLAKANLKVVARRLGDHRKATGDEVLRRWWPDSRRKGRKTEAKGVKMMSRRCVDSPWSSRRRRREQRRRVVVGIEDFRR